MDISKASNFERFVFDLLGRDAARVGDLFGTQLARQGFFDLGADPAFKDAASRFGFASGRSTHADRLATIRATFDRLRRDGRHPYRRRHQGGACTPACRAIR